MATDTQFSGSAPACMRRALTVLLLIIVHSTSLAGESVFFGASHAGPEGESTLHRIDPVTGAATPVGSEISCGDTEATLFGSSYGAEPFLGTEMISTAGCETHHD